MRQYTLFLVVIITGLFLSPNAEAQDVTISANTTWTDTSYSVDTLHVMSSATLTIESSVSSVSAASIIVDSGSRISADGKGYPGGEGPGAGGVYVSGNATGGGGYGGGGGRGASGAAVGGPRYGSALAPTDLGSGGGGTVGGAGGGAIILNVSDTLTVDGAISANGLKKSGNGGGGSGGSIYITAKHFAGTGSITANGGDQGAPSTGRHPGGGGGGRIAVHYETNTFTGTLEAIGGLGRVPHGGNGGSGTIEVLPFQPVVMLYPGQLVEIEAVPGVLYAYQVDIDTADVPGLLATVLPMSGAGTWRTLGRIGPHLLGNEVVWMATDSTRSKPFAWFTPHPKQNSYYVGVVYTSPENPIGDTPRFQVAAAVTAQYVGSFSVHDGAEPGTVEIQLSGFGFAEGVIVQLLNHAGEPLQSYSPSVLTPTSLAFMLDIRDLDPQVVDIAVVWPDGSSLRLAEEFIASFTNLEARLIVPERVRDGRAYTMLPEYENAGGALELAPLFIVSSPQDVPMALSGDKMYRTGSIQILGLGRVAPFETIQPGQSNRIPIRFIAPVLPPHATGRIDFELAKAVLDDTPVNWNEIGVEVQPEGVSQDVWDRLWPLLTDQFGPTWRDYHLRLVADAGYLSTPERPVYDVKEIFGFEVRKALGMNPRIYLAGNLDAYCPSSGLPLAFGRAYLGRLDKRLYLGPFGRGWTHTFDMHIKELDNGDVVLHDATGFSRYFTRNRDWSFTSSPGDNGKLILLASHDIGVEASYALVEKDGSRYLFTPGCDLGLRRVYDRNYNTIEVLPTELHANTGDYFSFGYDGDRIVSMTDHAGRVTTYEYDSSNEHLIRVIAPGGVVAEYTYEPVSGGPNDHALRSITYPDGTHYYYDYDQYGRLASEYGDGNAEQVFYEYDAFGRVTISDNEGGTLTLSPDAYGLPKQIEDALGRQVTASYDSSHNLLQLINPATGTANIVYDHVGNILTIEDALSDRIRFAYNYQLNLPMVLEDARDNVTTFAYDGAGNLTGMTYPDSSAETFGYDTAGNLTTATNRRSDSIAFTRNGRGQVTRRDYPDGSFAAYTYDDVGRLIEATDASGTINLAYDDRGFLSSIEYPSGHWFTFEHNDSGQRTRRVGDDGYELNYLYDAVGRLEYLVDGVGAELIRYEYDSAGRLSAEYKGNGTYTTYTYDAAGQLVSMVNYAPDDTVQSHFDYTYDDNGNRTSMTTLDGITTYDYDATGQLTGVTYPSGGWTTYEYDAAGNRIAVAENGVVTSYTANNMNQYTHVGPATYTYDADGNMTSKTDAEGTTIYAYDYENRLVSVAVPSGDVWEYTYDALGNRTVVVQNGIATNYVHDPIGLVDVAVQYDHTGTLTARYTHGIGLVSRVDSGGDSAYYAFDAVGNSQQMTDANGTLVSRYAYSPFGILLQSEGSDQNPFRFSGRFGVMSEDVSPAFMRHRYYSPALGRFQSQDPIRFLGGQSNLYTYALNAPTGNVDPDGLSLRDAIHKNPARKQSMMDDLYRGDPGADPDTDLRERQIGGEIERNLRRAFGEVPENTGKLGDLKLGPLDWLDKLFKEWVLKKLGLHFSNKDFGEMFYHFFIKQPRFPTEPLDSASTTVIRSFDPNEKVGSAGYGEQQIVEVGDTLQYIVYFENQPTATAPAQEVFVSDSLDSDLDWSTFRITEITWGDHAVAIPDDTAGFATRETIADYREEVGKSWWVDVAVDVDYGTGEVLWTFRMLDPDTGELPEDVFAGFLPPNDDTHRGEGHVSFSILPKSDLQDGTVITNQASIVFDVNAPIVTNEVFNTIGDLNREPGLVNPGPQSDVEEESVFLLLHADDPDDDVLTYAATGLPPGLTLHETKGAIHGTLTAALGDYTVTVNVSDGSLTDSETFIWTVLPLNTAPSLTNPGSRSNAEGDVILLQLIAQDPDDDPLAFEAAGLPPDLAIDPLTGVIAGILTFEAAGTYEVAVSVTDGVLSDATTFIWTVSDTNRPPSVDAGPDQVSVEGALITLAPATFSDLDPGDTHTASINWGDGSALEPGIVDQVAWTVSGSHCYLDEGAYIVTVEVADNRGGMAVDDCTVDVANVAPVVEAGPDDSVEVHNAVSISPTYSDPGVLDTHSAHVDWDDGDVTDMSVVGGTFVTPHTYSTIGPFTVDVTVSDYDGGVGTDSLIVNVVDTTPPVITLLGDDPVTLEVHSAYTDAGATASDNYEGDISAAIVTVNNVDTSVVGAYAVTYDVTDSSGNAAAQVVRAVNVVDTTPPVTSLTAADPNPVAVDIPVVLTAFVEDNYLVVSAEYSVDGGSTWTPMDPIDQPAPSASVSATVPGFSSAGIYWVSVRAVDTSGNTGEPETIFLAVFDPDEGFVTGGGWFYSLPGAYPADVSLEGRANFGFVSKYKKGATVPTGVTEFQFKVADLSFHSNTYEWLVVANAKAMYKGVGTINGVDGYKFMISAIDGDLKNSGASDTFRIRIWKEVNGTESVIYDNHIEATIDADPTTTLGGGSIKIHSKK